MIGISQTRAAVITNRENVVITRHAPELIANVREPALHCTFWVLAHLVAPPCLAHPETHGSTLNTLDVVPRRIQQHVDQVSKQHSHSFLTQRRAVLLSAVTLVAGMSHDALSSPPPIRKPRRSTPLPANKTAGRVSTARRPEQIVPRNAADVHVGASMSNAACISWRVHNVKPVCQNARVRAGINDLS